MSKTILIVEDDDDTRSIVRTIVSKEGYNTAEVATGEDALEYFEKSGAPDLAILDIMMPGISGLEVALRMKQQPKTQRVPIIILTAKDSSDDMLLAYKDYSIDYYIPKPFTAKQLTNGINIGEESEHAAFNKQYVELIQTLAPSVSSIRSLGTAAYASLMVASGSCTAYIAYGCKSWDLAAVSLIVEEAGGICKSTDGSDLDLSKTEKGVWLCSQPAYAKLGKLTY